MNSDDIKYLQENKAILYFMEGYKGTEFLS